MVARRLSVRAGMDQLLGGVAGNNNVVGAKSDSSLMRQSDLATSGQSDKETLPATREESKVHVAKSPVRHVDTDKGTQYVEVVKMDPNGDGARGDLSPKRQGDLATAGQSDQETTVAKTPVPNAPVAKSPDRQGDGDDGPQAARVVKKDFYIRRDQDLAIDRRCGELKAESGRATPRSSIVQEALDFYLNSLKRPA